MAHTFKSFRTLLLERAYQYIEWVWTYKYKYCYEYLNLPAVSNIL